MSHFCFPLFRRVSETTYCVTPIRHSSWNSARTVYHIISTELGV